MTTKKRPKRRRDHAADFDRAADDMRGDFRVDPRATYQEEAARARACVEAYDSAESRMATALDSIAAGLRIGSGITPKPSPIAAACDRIAREHPDEFRAFAAGQHITDERLRQMIGPRRRVKLNSVRRRLTRYREGTARNAVKLPARGPIARMLDRRNGVIHQEPPFDLSDIFPAARRFRRPD